MKNKYEIRGDVTAIFLNKKDGTVVEALFDTIDLPLVDSFPNTWFSHKNYVSGWTDQGSPYKQRRGWYIHRLIMNAPDEMVVDHINHNTLDNRRNNLRVVTIGENNQNLKGARADNKSSGVRGVTWSKRNKKWAVVINVDRGRKNIGYFDDLETAKTMSEEAIAIYHPLSKQALEKTGDIGIIEKQKSRDKERPHKHNKSSGIRNITWSKKSKKWQVGITKNKKSHYYLSDNLDEAIKKLEELRSTLI